MNGSLNSMDDGVGSMLSDYPKSVSLRNGQQVLLRQMQVEDESRLNEFFSQLTPEDRLYLKEDVTDPAVIHRWVENLDFERVIPILAFLDDRIIGDASLHRNRFGWSKHVGELRMVIHPKYQGLGLGSRLAREMFFLALKLRLEKVMVQMPEEQVSAVQVFTRLGFHQEAILKKQVVDTKGYKHNLVIMSQNINEFWNRLQDLFDECNKDRSV